MSIDSLAIVDDVGRIFSDPARSTNCNFEVIVVSNCCGSTVSTVSVNMQCEREL
jgi:hypothetical protein